jgi:hypothetical protein
LLSHREDRAEKSWSYFISYQVGKVKVYCQFVSLQLQAYSLTFTKPRDCMNMERRRDTLAVFRVACIRADEAPAPSTLSSLSSSGPDDPGRHIDATECPAASVEYGQKARRRTVTTQRPQQPGQRRTRTREPPLILSPNHAIGIKFGTQPHRQ